MGEFVTYTLAGLALGCSFALVGSGFVVIHRVTRVVNFAQGTFAVVAGLLTTTLLGSGLPHGVSESLSVLAAGVVGIVIGVIAIGRRGTDPLSSLVITLGLGIFAYAVEIMLWGDQPRSFPGIGGSTVFGGARVENQALLIIAVTLLTFAAIGAFFGRTYLGKALTACSSNPYAAKLVGIDTRRMGLLAFGLGGALGGLAGVLITPIQSTSFDYDVTIAVNGFAAAVVGGLMRSGLALIGGLVLGVAQTLVAGYVNGSIQTEVALGLMLVLMVWQVSRQGVLRT